MYLMPPLCSTSVLSTISPSSGESWSTLGSLGGDPCHDNCMTVNRRQVNGSDCVCHRTNLLLLMHSPPPTAIN